MALPGIRPGSPAFLPGTAVLMLLVQACMGGAGPDPCPQPVVSDPNGNYIVPGVQGEILYREIDGRRLALDAFRHSAGPPRPGVILIHGGAWWGGSRTTFVTQWFEFLTRLGLNWLSVDYRVGPGAALPQQLSDLEAALSFVECNAAWFGVDPQRLYLLGEHAGAYLAARVAAARPGRVHGLILVGGLYDPTSLREWNSSEAFRRQLTGGTAPPDRLPLLRAAAEGMPPLLLIHGSADSEVPVSQVHEYCGQVRSTRGECTVFEVEGAGHRAENWLPVQQGYRRVLADWLEKHTGGLQPDRAYPDHPNLRKDIPYAHRTGSQDDMPLLLDAWVPGGSGPFPAVVLVHGGGWEAGDKVTYLAPLLGVLARAGFAWFSVDYRLTPEVTVGDQFEDIRRAVRWIRHHAPEFNVDPRRIVLLGESAGGHLAMQVGLEACDAKAADPDPVERQPCRVAGIVSFYGVYDFLPLVTDASPRSFLVRLLRHQEWDETGRALLRRISPYYHVHAGMPPVLLIHGTAERLWEQGRRMHERLLELGVSTRLVALEGAPHGLENWEGRPEWSYREALVDWLYRTLGNPGSPGSLP
ncbi:MAG: hypothetical protein Kow001_24640 [Acidobacteriota bacterium]